MCLHRRQSCSPGCPLRVWPPVPRSRFSSDGIHNYPAGNPLRRSVRSRSLLPSAPLDPAPSGRLTQTALEHSEHLGWAEIRHPYHPLRGQRFPVLKKRRIAATDTLILRGLDCGTFSVAREWTDWADPSAGDSLKLPRGRLDAESLLALVTLLEQLPQPPTEKS